MRTHGKDILVMSTGSSSGLARVAFAVITATLLLFEITLTRIFSGTIGYYFAFMSISVAMLGLGAGSLWVTLRGEIPLGAMVRAARASLGLGASGAIATLVYLAWYPTLGLQGTPGHVAFFSIFAILFVPFLFGGIITSVVFEANKERFAVFYAVDLLGAAAGCVVAVWLLDAAAAPKAMLIECAVGALAGPLFFVASGRMDGALRAGAGWLVAVTALLLGLRGTDLFEARVIRNQLFSDVVLDRWNDFSRVIVKRGPFFTWGLSETYETSQDPQYDLLIEGVAGTQVQKLSGDPKELDFLRYDITSLPHLLRPTGSALVLGVGAGLDVLMAKAFDKDPVVGVEVNPLVGDIVNNDFGDYSGRPYHLPGVTVNFENARTFVKRDRAKYDVLTVTWVDSGAATGAGAFALTENYLYTVEAFKDYLARLKDDGVLSFMRARSSPPYDAIKGIGIAVEALRQLGVADPGRHVIVSAVESPHFSYREMVEVMIKRSPFSAQEIATVEEARRRLHFDGLYTPGVSEGDPAIGQLIQGADRAAVYASFPFDMEPTTDDRPFYFFLRERPGQPAGHDVRVLRQAIFTIFILIAIILGPPLAALFKRRTTEERSIGLGAAYFALIGLGFMLIEMKLLQQSVLIIGQPTLSLSAVLASLLLSTGVGALVSSRILRGERGRRGALALFAGLSLLALPIALAGSESLASTLTAFPLAVRTLGLVLAIAPLGILLGCPMPLGMALLVRSQKMVAWAWGINGMFGVAGSAIAIYLAIHHGLRATFFVGTLCYLLAGGALALGTRAPRIAEPGRADADPTADLPSEA
jgi:predicted membrane-bound spermidine synthase